MPVSPVPIRARRPVVAVHHRELDSVAGVAVVTAADVAVAVLRHREAIQTSRLSRRQQPDHRSKVSSFLILYGSGLQGFDLFSLKRSKLRDPSNQNAIVVNLEFQIV